MARRFRFCHLTALAFLVCVLSPRSSATAKYDVLFYSAGPYAPCGTSGNFSAVGAQGALEPYKGEARSLKGPAVSGRVTVYDDCYFALSDLSISASVDAPLSIWAGPKGADPYSHAAPVDPYAASSFPAAAASAFAPAGTAFNLTATSLVVVFLQAGGLTWDEAQVLYVCAGSASAGIARIYAQFEVGARGEHGGAHSKAVRWVRKAVGVAAREQRLLLPAPPARPPPPPPKPPAPGSSGPSAGLTNCVEAVPGLMNIYWTVHHADADAAADAAAPPPEASAVTGSATAPTSSGGGESGGGGGSGRGAVVEVGMEARVGEGSWVAFGVSRNQTRFAMLQSDVTVGGVLAGGAEGFALDFHITAKQPCQQVAGGFVGVCQDSLLAASPTPLNNVRLISAARRGDVTFIRFSKPAATSDDRFDANLLRAPGLSALWWVVFAAGPLAPASTAAAPALLFHDPALGYFAGGTRIPFAPPAPIRTCSPLWGSKPLYHPPLPPYAPPPPPGAAAPPPPLGADAAGGVAGMPGLRECSTAVGGQVYAFDACDALPGGFLLMWSLAGITLRAAFVAQAVPEGGYAAVGLSPSGAVVNSSLLVVAYTGQGEGGGSGGKSGGAGGAAGGVEVGQYVVRAASRGAGVEAVAGGDLTVVSSAGQARSGVVTLLFSLLLLPNQTAAAYLVWTKGSHADLSLAATAAAANDSATGGGSLSVDGLEALMTSAISFERGEPKDDANDTIRLWKIHGIISTVAWALLLPLGAMAARYLRQVYPLWFPAHQALQLAACSLATVAFTMAFTMPHGAIAGRADEASRGACVTAHTAMGIALMALAALQLSALVWRPHEDSPSRPYWRRVHAALGALTLLLGQAQVFIGLFISAAPLFYTVLLAAWVIFAVLLATALELHFFPTFYRLAHCRPRLTGGEGTDEASDVDSLCASSDRLAGGAGRKGPSGAAAGASPAPCAGVGASPAAAGGATAATAAEGGGKLSSGGGAVGGWVAAVVGVLRRNRGAGMLPEQPRGQGRRARGGKGVGRGGGRGGRAAGGARGSERHGAGERHAGYLGAGAGGYMSMASANAATDRRSKELLPPPPHAQEPPAHAAAAAAAGAGGVTEAEGAGREGARAGERREGVEGKGSALGRSQTVAEGGARKDEWEVSRQGHHATAAPAAAAAGGSSQSRDAWLGGAAARRGERGEGRASEGVSEGVSEYIRVDKYNVRATVVRAPDLALRGRGQQGRARGEAGEAGGAGGVGGGSSMSKGGGSAQ
ncbi:hypothetical protein CLOM_g10905 [Closterium sp. NIES-68]|nr:hypothetical protein CLOM_g10905 [Closterium sp. NIES-68]